MSGERNGAPPKDTLRLKALGIAREVLRLHGISEPYADAVMARLLGMDTGQLLSYICKSLRRIDRRESVGNGRDGGSSPE